MLERRSAQSRHALTGQQREGREGAVSKRILFDEFHLGVFVPRGLGDAEVDAIRQVLNDPAFQAHLRRLIRDMIRQYPTLSPVRVRLSR
jgi:hypothetical protein